MKDMMSYKGYLGSVHFSEDDELFYGKVGFIRALISYEGTSARELKTAFREAVDDYLAVCREKNIQPEKPFKGSFNVRLSPKLHQRLVALAAKKGESLNAYINKVLDQVAASDSGHVSRNAATR